MNNTIITQSVQDLSSLDIFGTGATDVLTTEDSKLTDLSITGPAKNLDDAIDTAITPKEEKEEEKETTPAVTSSAADILNAVIKEETQAINEEEQLAEPEQATAGRAKTDKNGLIDYLKAKIEAQEFGVSDEFDPSKSTLDDYLSKMPIKDLHELLDSNWKAKEEEIRNQTPQEFFEALPDEAKAVAEYAAKGGTDWKAFYQAMGKVEEVKQLDPANEDHHAPIVRSYLQATTKLSGTQIEEQIEDWKDSGKLDKKALEFKEPLDALQKEQAEAYLKQADEQARQRQELAQFYAENVTNTLGKAELGGIKLDKKFAKELQNGLIGTAPGPWSGKPVNLLGHVLEQHQFVNPDYETIAMMTWLGLDKEGFLNAIRQQGATKEVEKVVKLVKMEQGIKSASQPLVEQRPVKRLPGRVSNLNDLKRN